MHQPTAETDTNRWGEALRADIMTLPSDGEPSGERASLLSRSNVVPRFKAAAVHLAISLSIAAVLIMIVTQVWYPSPMFDLAKGRDIFLLLISCDITLGPLMTLIIFDVRKSKTELLRDVVIIAATQLAAMVYGLSTLVAVRPAYIVYNVGQFNVPLANELVAGSGAEKPDSQSDSPSAPWFGPVLVGSKLPDDIQENNKLIFSSVSGHGDVFQMPHYFVPYDDVRMDAVSRSLTVAQISKRLLVEPSAVDKATESYRSKHIDFCLLPLVIRTTTALAVVDRKTGDLIGIEAIPRDF
jgi:hypothetical protein